ncbi:MAG: GDP-mannose 4,6-dehydratase [Rickettsiales bacterium]|nr:GDP-mannose 4,6-dehydratase [Rickettsiales bacterium]
MVGLRFFTAYGAYGRPDMAIFKIADAIKNYRTVQLVSDGKVTRDFTHIDDIIDGVIKCASYTPKKDSQGFQNTIFNLGTGKKTDINQLTHTIAQSLRIEPKIEYIPRDPTDMPATLADISKAQKLLAYKPKIDLSSGIEDFVQWFNSYTL